ncbi:MAG: discoidin domain-containing protein [Bacteroidaceae bacterium]|nr:discoidin domain-containing protein [Bacteroidaceae bacterium]
MMSYDSNITNGTTAYTYLYPAELIPDVVDADGVGFTMGSREASQYNALRCSGQSIALPARTAKQNKLYLLWASANESGSTAKVTVGDVTYEINVPYFTGLAGEPLTTSNLESHYIRDNIALTATHAHNVSTKKNETMQPMYMYKACIDLPEGAESFSIIGTKVMLFSATVSDNQMDDIQPIQPLVVEAEYNELQVPSAIDGRLKPSSVKASHQNGTNEAGTKANDMDIKTKWCVVASQSQTPYLEYSFREPVVIERWLVLHAAYETSEYVTKEFKLQYQDKEDNWVDADYLNNNQCNKTFRALENPFTTQKVRLQILQGAQGDYVTRIYEFALYGHLESETGVIRTEAEDANAPTLYYSIDGIQRQQPSRGINIIRRAGKTQKIFIP